MVHYPDPAQTRVLAKFKRKNGQMLRYSADIHLNNNPPTIQPTFTAKLAADGWDTSIIITFVEEEPTTLVRTVRTILKNTPPALLREIILVDDGSSKGWLEQMYP